MPFNVNSNIVVTDERIVQSVSGAVGSRPGTPVTGMMFFNTTDSIMEVYNGTAWISSTVSGGGATPNAYAWGLGSAGALGDNTAADKSSPVPVVGGITDWASASAGNNHELAIRANGTLYAWGNNGSGRLGDNTIVNKSSPVLVAGGISDWIRASAGTAHSLGLRATGQLYAWGNAANGRLGDNTIANKSSPVLVAGGIAEWVSMSTGDLHNLAIRANGVLYAWGSGGDGRLGDGTTVAKSSPVVVSGGFTDWIGAATGYFHSLGVRANGTLYGWGRNANGQVGDNTAAAKSVPTLVVGGIVNWVSASCGDYHSLGIRADGTLYAWGNNTSRQLGDTTITSRSSPVLVVGGFTDWVMASGGNQASNGVRANGTTWGWGSNTFGMVGDGTGTGKSSPVLVAGGFTDWVSVNMQAQSTALVGIRAT